MAKPPSRLASVMNRPTPMHDTRRWPQPLLDDVQASATALSSDLATALAERVEELNTTHHEFRQGLHRAFLRVLTLAKRREQQVLLFDEALPGFTLLLFKKDPQGQGWAHPSAEPVLADPRQSPEMAASALVIEAFVARTHNRVLVIESTDSVFVFFPASDIKRNLKEMGFYHVD